MEQWFCAIEGRKYGPITEDTVRLWLAEGRLQRTDLAWREGMAEWAEIGMLPQFRDAGAGPPAAALPRAGACQPPPNAPGAVASMVCGIVGVVCGGLCCAGLVLGIVALNQRKKALEGFSRHPGKYGGHGFCTAGQVLGIIAIILGSLAAVYWLFWLIMMLTFAASAPLF